MQQAILTLNDERFAMVCDYLTGKEAIFLSIKNQYGFPPFWKREPGFASLVKIILEQQVSIASAKAHFEKLHAYSNGLQVEKLLSMNDEAFRLCAISRQKCSYIRDLCAKVNSRVLALEKMDELDDETAEAMLCSVKGIGPWTAAVYMMFCLCRPNHFPAGDVAITKAVSELFDLPGNQPLDEFARRWSPYRTVAAYFLWWYYLCSRKRAAVF